MSAEHSHEDPDEILDNLDLSGNVHEQVDAVFRAIRLADLQSDEEAAMRARITLLCIAPRTRYANEMIAAFSWCHGKLEEDPERYSCWEEDVVLQLENMVGTLVDYPNVSLQQLDEITELMEQSFRRLDLGMRCVAEQRYSLAMRTGDIEKAVSLLGPWLATDEPEDEEIEGWERLSQFELLMMQERHEEGLRMLQPYLQRCDRLSSDLFVWSVSHAMRPLWLVGRGDDARRLQQQALPLLREEPTDALGSGAHIAFLTRIDQLEEAVEVLEEFLEPGMGAPDPDAHFRIFAAAAGLTRALAESDAPPALSLPECHPLHRRGETRYNCRELADWFEEKARGIGQQFDQRNGTDYFNGRLFYYYNY